MGNNKRRIASLALFRNLYNEGRSDVMTILCEFVKNIVYTKHLNSFTPTQIRSELKTEFDIKGGGNSQLIQGQFAGDVEALIKKFSK